MIDLKGRAPRMTLSLMACYFVGFHLRLSLLSSDGATLVPMWSMLIPAALLAIIGWRSLLRRAGNLLLALLIVLLIQPVLALSPGSGGYIGLIGGMQLFVSVLAALIVINAARSVSSSSLRRLFAAIWAALIGLAALENYFGLRGTFASIRESLYGASGRGIYASELRDVQIYGQVRPSALASEPSFLAASYMTAAILVFMLNKNRGNLRSWIGLALMSGIGFAMAPSATVIFYLAALVLWHFWPRQTTTRIGAVMMGTAALSLASINYSSTMDRLSQIGVSETGSFYGRILVGPRVAVEALTSYPLLGFGVGNTDGVRPLILQEWSSSGALARFPWFVNLGAPDLMSNGFWWQWLFLGVFGGAIFITIVAKALVALEVRLPFRTIACTWIIWYAGAAFIDPASWCAFAALSIPALFDHAGGGQPEDSGSARNFAMSAAET